MADPESSKIQNDSQRQRIRAVATRQFSEKSYHGTSMRDLGEAMGIQAGSLYAHISSKEELLFEIIDSYIDLHQREMQRTMRSDESPVEKLKQVIHCQVTVIGENLEASKVYFHEWRNLDAKWQAMIVAKRDEFEEGIRGLITECIDVGEFPPLDVPMAARAMLGMSNWTYEWYSPDGPLSPAEVAEEFASYIIDGFRGGLDESRGSSGRA
jgi:TetR/AcrR family transcriptional regulator, cholesterol catabolism regulator